MDKNAPIQDDNPPERHGPLRRAYRGIQNRVLSGLLLALPIVLTIWIVYWLYTTLQSLVLDPLANLVAANEIGGRVREEMPFWWDRVLAPAIAFSGVIALLYLLGLLVRSRVVQTIDWIFLHVPGITTIYQAVNNLIQSFESQRQANRFKRVVLVSFPHPGMRSLGLVTNSIRDQATGRTILCVCLLTGVFPPTGFTLFIPEEECTDVDWTVNQTLQVIVSGGITCPASIPYFAAPSNQPVPTTPQAPHPNPPA